MRSKPVLVVAAVAALTTGLAVAPTASGAPAGRSVPKSSKHVSGHTPKKLAAGTRIDAAAAATALGSYRIAGPDRYSTAVEVSKESFPTGTWGDGSAVSTVTVASGTNFPDALAGGPYAAWLGPLLLVPKDGTVPPVVAAEIKRLNPTDIVMLGDSGAVSSSIESQLAALGPSVSRIAGVTRYDTAAKIAIETDADWKITEPDLTGVDGVYVATGLTFADSLAGGGAAAVNKGALVLTDPRYLPAETAAALQKINPPNIYVLGGSDVVPDAIINQIKALSGVTGTVTRLSGQTRYDTATAISAGLFTSAENVALVNGNNFPDALAAAPFAAIAGASTLLSPGPCVPAGTANETTRLGATTVLAIGGSDVVSDQAALMTVC